MTRNDSDPEMTDFQRGYDAARTGKVDHRHGRYWIDWNNGAELARPEVVKGIKSFYRDAAKTTLEDRNPAACAAQIEEWTQAFETAAIERHDDIH